jgi:hypothetical protein
VFQYKKLIKYQYDAETINLVKTELPWRTNQSTTYSRSCT